MKQEETKREKATPPAHVILPSSDTSVNPGPLPGKASDEPRLLLPLSSEIGVLVPAMQALEAMLAEPRDVYEVALVWAGGVYPDTALSLWSMLRDRPHPGRLVTYALSRLQSGGVLVWLAGDERHIADDAWIQVRLPRAGRMPAALAEGVGPIRSHQRMTSLATDELRVCSRILEILPSHFLERRVFPGEIAEWIDLGGRRGADRTGGGDR